MLYLNKRELGITAWNSILAQNLLRNKPTCRMIRRGLEVLVRKL
jgi:hypothetical protein